MSGPCVNRERDSDCEVQFSCARDGAHVASSLQCICMLFVILVAEAVGWVQKARSCDDATAVPDCLSESASESAGTQPGRLWVP